MSDSPKLTTNDQLQTRGDNWENIITRLGARNSRVNSTNFIPQGDLTPQELSDIYKYDGIAARIVNVVVKDALHNWIYADKKLLIELQRVKAKLEITDSAIDARLYGGSGLIINIDDGLPITKPINYNKIKKVLDLMPVSMDQISWDNNDLSKDFHSGYFGKPTLYKITQSDGSYYKIHRSRIYLFSGYRLPTKARKDNGYWDVSVLQPVFTYLRNFGISNSASSEIIIDFIQAVIGVNGLTEMLTREGGDQELENRANIIDLSRSIANVIFLDSEHETYEKKASSVAGLPELIDRIAEGLSAAAGMPLTKLMCRSPAGMNSTGKSDSDNWDTIVEGYRLDELTPCLDWIIKALEAQLLWPASERPKSYDWEFPSLKIQSEDEILKNRLATAEIYKIFIDRGAIEAGDLFKLLHKDGFFNTNLIIDESELKKYVRSSDDYQEEDIIEKEEVKVNDN